MKALIFVLCYLPAVTFVTALAWACFAFAMSNWKGGFVGLYGCTLSMVAYFTVKFNIKW